jgi:hypothetical protein
MRERAFFLPVRIRRVRREALLGCRTSVTPALVGQGHASFYQVTGQSSKAAAGDRSESRQTEPPAWLRVIPPPLCTLRHAPDETLHSLVERALRSYPPLVDDGLQGCTQISKPSDLLSGGAEFEAGFLDDVGEGLDDGRVELCACAAAEFRDGFCDAH